MIRKEKYVGEIFQSANSGKIKVLEYKSAHVVKYMFLDSGCVQMGSIYNIKSGKVRDKSLATVQGVGVFGNKILSSENDKKKYELWVGILQRCCDKRSLLKRPTYDGCSISENFKSFEYFSQWCDNQIGFGVKDFQLDKDILSVLNKIYSEHTCVFIPREINMFFVINKKHRGNYPIGVSYCKRSCKFKSTYSGGGEKYISIHEDEWSAFLAYKRVKEARAKDLAEKWKHSIDKRVYDKLMSYKVLLTD